MHAPTSTSPQRPEAPSQGPGPMDPSCSGHTIPTLGALFAAFFRVGCTAFGGPAMLPVVRTMTVEKRGWMSEQEFKGGVATCQAVPGATVMQVAALVGLRRRGIPGMLCAFAGFVLPAFILITVLSALYWKNRELPQFIAAFIGIKAVTLAIMLYGAVDFGKRYIRNIPDLCIAAGAATLVLLETHPLLPVVLAMLAGCIVYREQDNAAPPVRCTQVPSLGLLARRMGAGLALVLAVVGTLYFTHPEMAQLALSMIRTDLVAFGGALASLPIMRHEVVNLHGWVSDAAFVDGLAIGQITPGPIIMTSAFIGWKVAGLSGAAIAGLAIFTPSLLMLLMADTLLARLESSRMYRRAVRASLAGLTGLLATLIITVGRTIPLQPLPLALVAGGLMALFRKVDPAIVVIAGAALSILLA